MRITWFSIMVVSLVSGRPVYPALSGPIEVNYDRNNHNLIEDYDSHYPIERSALTNPREPIRLACAGRFNSD